MGRDHDLVRQVVHKLYLNSSKYMWDEQDLVEKTYSFFAKMIRVEKRKMFPLPFKKEDIESWIEEYRKKFELPEDYFKDSLLYIER